jgi:hypothetical protein
MPHVTTHYRVLVVAGHHRQPRNATSWIEPNPQSDAEVVGGTTITPYAPPQLAYLVDGQAQVANFLFWSASDGIDGQTTTSAALNQTVASAPMTLTAWYVPPGGLGGNGGSGYLLDAFSDAVGDFVDDTFVTVTSDASLTSQANVVGIIPTTSQETLEATASIHTGENFEHWIGGNPSGTSDTLAVGTSGIAIATYHNQHIPLPKAGVNEREGQIIMGGIAVDGDGYAYPIGHPGGGGPVGPWGPFIERVSRAALLSSLAASTRGLAEIEKIALSEIADAAKQLQAQVSKQIQG